MLHFTRYAIKWIKNSVQDLWKRRARFWGECTTDFLKTIMTHVIKKPTCDNNSAKKEERKTNETHVAGHEHTAHGVPFCLLLVSSLGRGSKLGAMPKRSPWQPLFFSKVCLQVQCKGGIGESATYQKCCPGMLARQGKRRSRTCMACLVHQNLALLQQT